MADDDRPVTIHAVARRAGVAVSSVSRVLSKHPDVSEKMRVKVEAAARELGYSPDPVARSLRSGSSRLIGYLVRDFQTPFFGDVIEGLEAVLSAEGYTLLVLNGGGEPAKELERISVLKQRRVDGLFLSTLVDSTARLKSAVEAFGRPVVLIDRDLPGVEVGRAQFDHATGVQDATADLVSLGHTRIALITGAPDVRPTRERVRGFRLGLESSAKAMANATEVTGAFSIAFAREKTAELLALPTRRRPTALVSGGVQATIGIIEALSEAGLRPGEDISLVVVDDLPWLRVLRPTISAVFRDPGMIGRVAAGLMVAQLAGERPSTVSLPTHYEPRESSVKVGSR